MINYNLKSFVDGLMYTKRPELLKSFELIFAQLKNSSEKEEDFECRSLTTRDCVIFHFQIAQSLRLTLK